MTLGFFNQRDLGMGSSVPYTSLGALLRLVSE